MTTKWAQASLADISENLDNQRVPVSKLERNTGKIPYYGATGIVDYVDDYIFDEELLLIGEDGADWTAGANTSYVIKGKSWVNNHAHVLRINKADIRFVNNFLNFADLRNHTSGTTRGKLNKSDLMNIRIPFPSLSIQNKIGDILSSIDEAIQKTDQLIQKTEELKSGLMNELLSKGIGHRKFKKTKLGEIPEEWRIISLGEIVEKLEAGVSVNSEDKQIIDGEFGILKTSSVTYRFFDPSQHKKIIDKDLTRARVKPLKDRIIISRMNTPLLVGASAYVDKDYKNLFLPDRLWQIELIDKSDVSAKWLSYQFSWLPTLSRIRELASGTSASMKNISKQKLLTLEIAIPPYQEQISIAELLQSVDNKNKKEKIQMNSLKKIKNGLMHDIFNQKVQIN